MINYVIMARLSQSPSPFHLVFPLNENRFVVFLKHCYEPYKHIVLFWAKDGLVIEEVNSDRLLSVKDLSSYDPCQTV